MIDLCDMEALSVRQPWAWLIVQRRKLFENRDWSHGYPARRKVVHGKRILIHAAAGMTRDEYAACLAIAGEYGVEIPAFADLRRGGIVGWAVIQAWRERRPNLPFAFGSGIELNTAGALGFMPCKGALGFFKPEFPSREAYARMARELAMLDGPEGCTAEVG